MAANPAGPGMLPDGGKPLSVEWQGVIGPPGIEVADLRPLARDDLVILPLADAAEGVVLAQRVVAVPVPRQDPPEVRVADEDDAVHVVDLPLHPLGAGPDRRHAVHLQPRVAALDDFLVADLVPLAPQFSSVLGVEVDLQ